MGNTESNERQLFIGVILQLLSKRRIKVKTSSIQSFFTFVHIKTTRFSHFFRLFPYAIVQSLSRVQLFATPWPAAHQASLSITNSRSLLKLMSITLVMSSNHLILCHPLLFPPSIIPRIRVFSNESVIHIKWPKYWSFSFSISPSNEYSRVDFL